MHSFFNTLCDYVLDWWCALQLQARQYQQGGKIPADRTANRYNPIGSGGGYGGGGSNGPGYSNYGTGSPYYNFSTPSFTGGSYASFSGMSSVPDSDSYGTYWAWPLVYVVSDKYMLRARASHKYTMQSTYSSGGFL